MQRIARSGKVRRKLKLREAYKATRIFAPLKKKKKKLGRKKRTLRDRVKAPF